MRLIDADAVDIEYWNHMIVDEGCLEETQAMFNAEPTVEAIPITWLKRWGATNWTSYEMTNEILFEVHFKPIILRAIEDWEHKRGEWE